MRTLLLTVLVSFNLVACVAGDNDVEGQEIDGIAEASGDMEMDVGMAEHQVATSKEGVDVDLQALPARKNKYKEAESRETLADQVEREALQPARLGQDGAEQVDMFDPNAVEEIDMVELLRGIHLSR